MEVGINTAYSYSISTDKYKQKQNIEIYDVLFSVFVQHLKVARMTCDLFTVRAASVTFLMTGVELTLTEHWPISRTAW